MKRELAYREEMVQQLQIVRHISLKMKQLSGLVFKSFNTYETVFAVKSIGPLASQLA